MYIFYREQNRFLPDLRRPRCDFDAITRPWTRSVVQKNGRKTKLPDCGQILFSLPCVGAGLVSHEMTHAAIRWAERVRLGARRVFNGAKSRAGVSDEHERFCQAQGQLVSEFWTKFYRLTAQRRGPARPLTGVDIVG